MKNSRSKGFWLAKHKHTNIPTMMEPFSPPARGRGWTRLSSKGFSRINLVKEKIIYFYCLSVNYNNRSPAFGNDSQNGIHCCRRAAKICELTNNIVMNNNIARLNFYWTITRLFSYSYARHKINERKNGPALRAISMAMQIRRYPAERIAQ